MHRRMEGLAPPHPELAYCPGLRGWSSAEYILDGWSGLKNSLLGTGLAFALLLPLWLPKDLGADDVKFAAALGAFTGLGRLFVILIGWFFVVGFVA